MEARSSVVQESLEKTNAAFMEYITFYGSLVENGVVETDYGKTFEQITENIRHLYATAKSNYDALLMNRKQFEEGRLERDAFERTLVRIEQNIIEAEFDIGIKVLPYLKRVEKQLLQNHILRVIEEANLPSETKKEVREDAEEIQMSMTKVDDEGAVTQVREYVSSGKKIMKLGHKVWKAVELTTPAVLTSMLPIFMGH